ncbi:retromer complex subunit Vps35 [Ceratocystis pirilliformis]|uniref:Vacuolar protein sorting-associated protein 35 n=1 Tax=Ceratocystis pirilliformis TaxID=259994 RepID=A0ABR3Z4E4_9PEZI
MSSAAPVPEDQARLLDDALTAVRQQTNLMRKCLDQTGKLMDALKCCSTLVSELRTSSLGPKQYYELYMAVFDALRYLSVHLRENHPVNHLADLYELVQYAGNIVPRMYLMITVGTAYMSVPDAPVKELMKDMMDMTRGVQHPIRGLFLRYYLSGQARDCLPSGGGDGPEGNLQDSVNFVLTNFVEMNKLWVRLQHQGHSREREHRLRERKELQLLVGSNIVRLSQLVDLSTYKSTILAPLLEQVVQCRDVLAQEYLLEVITQVFPDEYHLHTLDQLLGAVSRLNPHVNVKVIVIGIMDRLSDYAEREGQTGKDNVDRAKQESEALVKLLESVSIKKSGSTAAASPNYTTTTTTTTTANIASLFAADEGFAAPDVKDEPTPKKEDSEDSLGVQDSTETSKTNGRKSPSPEIGTETGSPNNEQAETPTPGEGVAKVGEDAKTETPPEVEEPQRGIPKNVNLYEIFFTQVKNLVDIHHLVVQDTIALLVSLSNLALNIYPDRLDYIDQILEYGLQKVKEFASHADLHSAAAQHSLLALLQAPLNRYVSVFTALSLPTFVPLCQAQGYATRRALAGEVVRNLLRNYTLISQPSDLENVLEILKVIIKEGSAATAGYAGVAPRRATETDETIEEQSCLARMVHLLQSDDNDTQFRLLQMTRRAYSEGNERIRTTTPPLITACMKLARRFKTKEHLAENWETQSNALYKFMHSAISTLYTRVNGVGAAELALRLFCVAGQTADGTNFEEVAYEFFAQAFTVYEEAITDSKAQFQAVAVIASALHTTRNFGRENYDTLITKCAQHGSKLLRKPDQCRAVYLASHLWWATPNVANGESEERIDEQLYRDGKRVLECLQRALRVADSCMESATSIELFVEILDRYVYYFDHQNESVTTKYLNGLIELIHSNLAQNAHESAQIESSRKHFNITLEHIRERQYDGIVLNPQ